MALIVYDKAKWHFGSDNFPKDLPDDCGGTHTAFFLRWCLENDFLSKTAQEDFAADIEAVKQGKMNCRDLLMNGMDGVFTSDELNTKGRKFANAYYNSEKTKFAKQYGYYLADYEKLIAETSSVDDSYRFENSEENYLLIKELMDRRYQEFLS